MKRLLCLLLLVGACRENATPRLTDLDIKGTFVAYPGKGKVSISNFPSGIAGDKPILSSIDQAPTKSGEDCT